MRKKIFRSLILVSVLVLLLSTAISSTYLHSYFNKELVDRLSIELDLAANAVNSLGESYLEGVMNDNYRFTIVQADGSVIYDSKVDSGRLGNHLDREEIREALTEGRGSSARYSDTLTEKTFYEAVMLRNRSVLRISVRQLALGGVILRVLPMNAVIAVIAIVLSFLLAHRMAKRITAPLSRLDLDNPEQNATYEELNPILTKIYKQHKQITEQMADAERTRQEFTANVSHELKTPLQSIIGSAELLENGLVKPVDTPRFVGNIKKEATRLVSLINDIIRLSQLDEKAEQAKEPVDLSTVAMEVVEVLTPSANQKGVLYIIDVEPVVFVGVKRYLYEILYNLCDNAIRYNRTGGKVFLSIHKQAGFVLLSVADTGIGIPTEQQDRIFERFYRVDKSHSKETGGTGLGLSIVKRATLLHNGKLSLESVEGKGTKITVQLPLS